MDIVNADYRYNMRPPQGPPRIPPNTHHIKKKWHMPHVQQPPPPSRMAVRKRMPPNLIHNNLNFKHNVKPLPPKRQIVQQLPLKPAVIPTRNIWKNNIIFNKPEKLFLSSPTVKTPEYEYHIQTNNIPTHPSINQIDYKGPIHTIPAPKLSPADKPKNIETVKPIERENTIVQIQKAHQYQVTESSDLFNNKKQFIPEIETLSMNQDVNAVSKVIAPLSTQELFKLFNTYNQQQQQHQQQQQQPPTIENTYTLPLTQQPQLQTHIFTQNTPATYQTLVAQTGLFQPETGFVNQNFNQNYNKPPFQPEYQTFNFEEPALSKQDDQSVTTNLDFLVTSNEQQNKSPLDALAQTQYVQRFFDTRTDDVNNNVEPDARPAIQNFDTEKNNNEETVSGSYYTLLPNQKAADTLASLQEAGKRNNKGKNMNDSESTQNQSIQISPPVPMTIYVPDEYDDTGEQMNTNNQNDNDSMIEKGGEDNTRSKNRVSFGSRTKPKSN